jgi:hypothetical protein
VEVKGGVFKSVIQAVRLEQIRLALQCHFLQTEIRCKRRLDATVATDGTGKVERLDDDGNALP